MKRNEMDGEKVLEKSRRQQANNLKYNNNKNKKTTHSMPLTRKANARQNFVYQLNEKNCLHIFQRATVTIAVEAADAT